MSKQMIEACVRVAAYIRVSTDRQDAQRQRAAIEAWAKARGYVITAWFEDLGYSRDLPHRRPDFLRMIAAIEQDQFGILIVDHRDRFGVRDQYDFGRWASILRDHDCELWSVAQGHLTGDDLGSQVIGAVESGKSSAEQVDLSWRVLGGMKLFAEKGEWLGGIPPYGYDVLCVAPDGSPKWVVRYNGHNTRLRIWPDGRVDPYDGRDNFPPKDLTDRLFLTPSDPERVDTVRLIFHWWTSESISVRGIATRLNDLGIPPVFGQAWYHFRVRKLLQNPVFASGLPSWGKESQGRFYTLERGERVRVKWVKGRPPGSRIRDRADHITPRDPQVQGQGLVDPAVWEAAQVKLAQLKGKSRAPKSSLLWISGLAYCWRCHTRMAGWTKDGGHRTYVCSSYRTYGRHNQYGCELHQVRHDVLEHYIDRYLADTGQAIETVLHANAEDLPELEDQETDARRVAYIKALHALWRAVRQAGKSPPDGQPWSLQTLVRVYQEDVGPDQLAAVQAKVAAKLAEMDRLVEQFAALTSKLAQDRANKRMETLEREINELQEQARPLDLAATATREELERREQATRAAREAMAGDSNRRKAQALGRVVARIVCRFDTELVKGRMRSFLREVTFEPLLGEVVSYAAEGSDRRRCSRR
jgi:DNA invertase Pin-like site-specific DNA recombinase